MNAEKTSQLRLHLDGSFPAVEQHLRQEQPLRGHVLKIGAVVKARIFQKISCNICVDLNIHIFIHAYTYLHLHLYIYVFCQAFWDMQWHVVFPCWHVWSWNQWNRWHWGQHQAFSHAVLCWVWEIQPKRQPLGVWDHLTHVHLQRYRYVHIHIYSYLE